MDKNEMQAQAEQVLADMEAERGLPFNEAWQDTLLVLMKSYDISLAAVHRVADTINMVDRESGVLPKKPLRFD